MTWQDEGVTPDAPSTASAPNHHDLMVIGSGSGNTFLDERFEHLSVAMVERDAFGGTCLNRGCIPSKMYVLAADAVRGVHDAARLGVTAEVTRRMRSCFCETHRFRLTRAR